MCSYSYRPLIRKRTNTIMPGSKRTKPVGDCMATPTKKSKLTEKPGSASTMATNPDPDTLSDEFDDLGTEAAPVEVDPKDLDDSDEGMYSMVPAGKVPPSDT